MSYLAILGLFLWVALSGALFLIGVVLFLAFVIISTCYSDSLILFFLGAREVRSRDEKKFFEAASQESYKLAVPLPKLYFYNGSLERAFVLQKRNEISIVLDKGIMEKTTSDELKAICFELLLQVKKGLAAKRTRAFFIIGSIAWVARSIFGLLSIFIPYRNLQKGIDWVLSYFLRPVLDFLFHLLIGERYFRKLETMLSDYPDEKERLEKVGMRLLKDPSYYSLPSRKLLEFSSSERSRYFHNIITIEFLPHEWDYFFHRQDLKDVQ